MVKQGLAEGYYVTGDFIARYQPNREAYRKYDHRHDILIYGFDDMNGCFVGAGYGKRGIYEEYTLSYDDFYDGLRTLEGPDNRLVFLRVKDGYVFTFDYNHVWWQIKAFLDSAGTYRTAGPIWARRLRKLARTRTFPDGDAAPMSPSSLGA